MKKIKKIIKENFYQVIAMVSLVYTIIVFGSFFLIERVGLDLINLFAIGFGSVSFFFSLTFGSVYILSCKGTTKSKEYDGSILPKAFVLFSLLFVVGEIIFGLYKNDDLFSILILTTYIAFVLYWTIFGILNKLRNSKMKVI